jgi:S-DNA-T family DNA segregation ATPase FtsK/SpoIIIE
MSRFDDPEGRGEGGSLPSQVPLLEALDLPEITPNDVLGRWTRAGVDPAPSGVVGLGASGPISIDLVRDGPHGLVGGATDTGKSELVLSFLCGLAAQNPPETLTFLMFDFKGGSALGRLELLPHTVRFVTNREPSAAQRALELLTAELEWRQDLLAEEGDGSPDIIEYRKYREDHPELPPLPRLLVVVDELAEMKRQLDDYDERLANVARIGRSLGVHLLLATQSPSECVTKVIEDNAPLRIALRLQNSAESTQLIGTSDAVVIPKTRRGRAWIRLAEDMPIVQSAYSGFRFDPTLPPVEALPFRPDNFGFPVSPKENKAHASDLERLVTAASQANEKWLKGGTGREVAHVPWLDPLPDSLSSSGLLPAAKDEKGGIHRFGVGAPVALVDDPAHLRRGVTGWDPQSGNLVIVGNKGSGTTTAGLTVLLREFEDAGGDVIVHGIDFGSRLMTSVLHELQPVSVASGTQPEAVRRLLTHLAKVIDLRREGAVDRMPTLFVIDGFGGFVRLTKGLPYRDDDIRLMMDKVFFDGPGTGIHTILISEQASSVPNAYLEAVDQRWIFRLTEGAEGLGPSRSQSFRHFVPGRGFSSGIGVAGLEIQVVLPFDTAGAPHDEALRSTARELRQRFDPDRATFEVRTLPDSISPTAVSGFKKDPDGWRVLVGVWTDDLTEAVLAIPPGRPLTVFGPRSGRRAEVLRALLESAARLDPRPKLLHVASADSRWAEDFAFDQTLTGRELGPLGDLAMQRGPAFVFVDAAEEIADEAGRDQVMILEQLCKSQSCMIVACADSAKLGGDHWLRNVIAAQGTIHGVILEVGEDFTIKSWLKAPTAPGWRERHVSMAGGRRGYALPEWRAAHFITAEQLEDGGNGPF